MNTLSQVSDLQLYFNRKYDCKEKTIDIESHNYIVSKAIELMHKIPKAKGGRIFKMIAKRQLLSIVAKSTSATKTKR